jgi:hypothetical protein
MGMVLPVIATLVPVIMALMPVAAVGEDRRGNHETCCGE